MTLAITGELGRFEEFFSEVVYPIRPLWLIGAILLAGAALYVAYRRRWVEVALRHRLISGAILASILVVSVRLVHGFAAIRARDCVRSEPDRGRRDRVREV